MAFEDELSNIDCSGLAQIQTCCIELFIMKFKADFRSIIV